MKKWFFTGLPLIVGLAALLFPQTYKENFLLFGTFLVWPVYLAWLPYELGGKYGESAKKAYIYPAGVLLIHEIIYLLAMNAFEFSPAGIVTMLLPWAAFCAGILVWRLIFRKKYALSLIPPFVLFFVSALRAKGGLSMPLTLCTVFAYISISFVSLCLGKIEKNNGRLVKSVKAYTLVTAIIMVLTAIFAVSNL